MYSFEANVSIQGHGAPSPLSCGVPERKFNCIDYSTDQVDSSNDRNSGNPGRNLMLYGVLQILQVVKSFYS